MFRRSSIVLWACLSTACIVKTESVEGISCWDLNGDGASDVTEDVNNDGSWDARDCAGQQGQSGLHGDPGDTGPPGVACWDLNGDGVQDAVEDVNNDSSWDALDCAGPQGPEGDSQWTPCAGGICYGGGNVAILDGEILLPGTSGSVRPAADDDVLILRGSKTPSDGGRIDLYGASHPTQPDVIRFSTFGLERIVVGANGNVGIGTGNLFDRLVVDHGPTHGWYATFEGGDATRFQLRLGSHPTSSLPTIQTWRAAPVNGAQDLLLNPYGGRVGIGTPTPVATLDVDGTARLKAHSGQAPFACDDVEEFGTIALNSEYDICICKPSGWRHAGKDGIMCSWP